MSKKILIPIFSAIALIIMSLSFLSFNSTVVNAGSDKTFLIKSKELICIEPTGPSSDPLWKTDELGSGYVGKWAYTVISPSASGAIAIVFTAPNDATLSGILMSAYNLHPVTAKDNNDIARLAVFKNNEKIYPTDDSVFKEVSDDQTKPTVVNDIADINLVSGDRLYFIAENGGNGNNSYDAVVLDFTCTYQDEDTAPVTLSLTQNATYKTDSEADMNEPSGIGNYTKSEIISYAFVEVLSSVNMEEVAKNDTEVILIDKAKLNWSEKNKFWCPSDEDVFPYMYHAAAGEELVPGYFSTIAIEFTAPTDGVISNKFGLGSFRKLNELKGTSDCQENDLARFSIIKENKVIYPSENIWENVPFADEEFKQIKFNSFDIKAGEKLYYVVENGGNTNNSYDNVLLKDIGFLWIDEKNPSGVWFNIYENFHTTDIEEESSITGYKKSEVISYLEISSVESPIPEAVDITKKEVEPIKKSLKTQMTFNTQHTELRIKSAPNLLVRADCCQPSELYMLALQWTAPKNGRVRISSSYINNFNYKTESQIVDGSISDGVRVKVILNDKFQIFPTGEKEWATTNGTENLYIDVDTFAVEAGDTIVFIIQVNKKEAYDTSVLQLVYDFAESDTGFTARYNSYDATAKMFATSNGSLVDTPWEYFAIMVERDVDRYFGGNTTELPLVPVKLADNFTFVFAGIAGAVVLLIITIVTIVFIKKRRLNK